MVFVLVVVCSGGNSSHDYGKMGPERKRRKSDRSFADVDDGGVVYRPCSCGADGYADVYVYYVIALYFLQNIQRRSPKTRLIPVFDIRFSRTFFERPYRNSGSVVIDVCFLVVSAKNPYVETILGLEKFIDSVAGMRHLVHGSLPGVG